MSLQAFITSKQQRTLGVLPEAVSHPADTLIRSYVEKGIPASTGPLWLRSALYEAIKNGSHASACAPEMVRFIRGELQRQVQDGFSILLYAEDYVQVFGENLNLSRIAAVPQAQRRPFLILNLLAQPNTESTSVNITVDRDITPESMQFGKALPRIIHVKWEADPEEGPFRVSKLDVVDAINGNYRVITMMKSR